MPKNVIAFNESKAYFSYDNKKYSSELGGFVYILHQICNLHNKLRESKVNNTDC